MINNVLTVNTESNSNITTKQSNIVTIPERDIELKVAPRSGGLFSDDIVFCHEDIIQRGLTIIANNPDVGETLADSIQRNLDSIEYKDGEFNHSLPLFYPNDSCVTAIAQHYKNKYNIDITCIKNDQENQVRNSLLYLGQKLNIDQKLGVIVKLNMKSKHVIPLILTKNDKNLHIIVFDGMSNTIFWGMEIIEKAYRDLISVYGIQYGKQYCQLIYAGAKRQRDYFSCMSDAIIILKDALRKDDLIQGLLADYTETGCCIVAFDNINMAIKYDLCNTGPKVKIAPLPKYLYKTVQRKKLLDQLTTADLQTPIISASNKSASVSPKTLAMHLEKYNCEMIATTFKRTRNDVIIEEKKSWQVNTYLQIKAYRILVHASKLLLDKTS